jgi:hypothetical protein
VAPRKEGEEACVAALWSEPPDPKVPRILRGFGDSVDFIEIQNAKIILIHDPAKIGLSAAGDTPALGAMFPVDGHLYVVVRDGQGYSEIRVADGAHNAAKHHDRAWFSSWSIATPEVDGLWRTICKVQTPTREDEGH